MDILQLFTEVRHGLFDDLQRPFLTTQHCSFPRLLKAAAHVLDAHLLEISVSFEVSSTRRSNQTLGAHERIIWLMHPFDLAQIVLCLCCLACLGFPCSPSSTHASH